MNCEESFISLPWKYWSFILRFLFVYVNSIHIAIFGTLSPVLLINYQRTDNVYYWRNDQFNKYGTWDDTKGN